MLQCVCAQCRRRGAVPPGLHRLFQCPALRMSGRCRQAVSGADRHRRAGGLAQVRRPPPLPVAAVGWRLALGHHPAFCRTAAVVAPPASSACPLKLCLPHPPPAPPLLPACSDWFKQICTGGGIPIGEAPAARPSCASASCVNLFGTITIPPVQAPHRARSLPWLSSASTAALAVVQLLTPLARPLTPLTTHPTTPLTASLGSTSRGCAVCTPAQRSLPAARHRPHTCCVASSDASYGALLPVLRCCNPPPLPPPCSCPQLTSEFECDTAGGFAWIPLNASLASMHEGGEEGFGKHTPVCQGQAAVWWHRQQSMLRQLAAAVPADTGAACTAELSARLYAGPH